MSLLLLTMAVAIAPPPPIVTVSHEPTVYQSVMAARAGIPPADFDVEVRGGGELLWSGPMRVSGRSGASFNRNKSDAPTGHCPTNQPFAYVGSTHDSLSISLNALGESNDAVRYQVNASWNRPQGDDCSDGQNSRSVGLAQSFDSGQRDVTISGDGGLTVRLRRR